MLIWYCVVCSGSPYVLLLRSEKGLKTSTLSIEILTKWNEFAMKWNELHSIEIISTDCFPDLLISTTEWMLTTGVCRTEAKRFSVGATRRRIITKRRRQQMRRLRPSSVCNRFQSAFSAVMYWWLLVVDLHTKTHISSPLFLLRLICYNRGLVQWWGIINLWMIIAFHFVFSYFSYFHVVTADEEFHLTWLEFNWIDLIWFDLERKRPEIQYNIM